MTRLRAFAGAGRFAGAAPGHLTRTQANDLGFPAAGKVAELAADIAARGVDRALVRAHRWWIAAYVLVGLVGVALGPVVPALVADVAGQLHAGTAGGRLIGVTIGAVTLAAAARWAATWVVRALVYQMSHALKLAVFQRLQLVRPSWLTAEGRSPLTYLATAPMQLAQLAFIAEFLVNVLLVVVLLGYLVVAFGWAGGLVAAVTGVIVAGWQWLAARQARRMHGYTEHGHARIALVDTVTRHWQSISRQQWEEAVLRGAEQARAGQLAVLRASARSGSVLGAIGGGVVPAVCLVALGGVPPATGLALLLVVQLLVTAVRENIATYGAVAWASSMAGDVDTLFRDAPLIDPAGPVGFGTATVPAGARVVLVGADADVRRTLDEMTGGGSRIVVRRGEPELDGSITANVTLWETVDPQRYADAVRRAGLDLPDRLLSTGRRRLSDGEAVRVGLARAWYHAPDVLILDDVLSALDPATAESVTRGIFGTVAGPTRVYAGTRVEPVAFADYVIECGPDGPVLTVAPGPAGPPVAADSRSGPILQDVTVETDVAAPPLSRSAAHLNGLYSRPALVGLAVLVAGLVVVELTTAGVLGRAPISVPAVALLAVAGAGLAGLHRLVAGLGPLTATRALHQRILTRMMRRGLPSGSATAAGRFTDDFTTVELFSPGILLGGAQAVVAAVVSMVAMALAAPAVLGAVALIVVPAALAYPRLRRASVRGRALLAATRGPARTFGGAVIGTASFTQSSGLRAAFERRYRDLVAVEHVAIHASHAARMRIVAVVEGAGVALFAATVAAAALAPTGPAALITVAVYAAYAIGQRFATLVEAHTEVDATCQVLGRVADLLDRPTLPRQRQLRDGPVRWLDPDTGAGTPDGLDARDLVTQTLGEPVTLRVGRGETAVVRGGSGAGKSVLLRTLAGFDPAVSGAVLVGGRPPRPWEPSGRASLRLVENDLPPLPLTVSSACGPAVVTLAAQWCGELGLSAADGYLGGLEPAQRQVVALAAACEPAPDVLLIDETTSSLDPARERRLLSLIRRQLPVAAIVVVLHRPDNVDLGDHEVLVNRVAASQ